MRILVVDDDIVSRTKLVGLFSKYGDCDKSPDGEIALKLFEEAHQALMPYELVSMDVEMPKMNGQEVVGRIRGIEQLLGIPVAKQVKILMVTSRREIKHVSLAYHEGCDEYLNKPATADDVQAALIKLGFKA